MRMFGVLSVIVLLNTMIGAASGAGTTSGPRFAAAATAAFGRGGEENPGRGSGTRREQAPVLLAAGDIAQCGEPGSAATAALLRDLPGTVATLGDNAYSAGSKPEFANCYDPTWGAEKERTRPAPGNHEYGTRGARGYFGYFGSSAGSARTGYYSYDLGAWHIVVLNSNCKEVGGCEADSPQGRWLRQDLAAHPTACTLAYWHHPLFSSGTKHGGDATMQPFWQALYDAGADVVLSSHEHNYERFAPQDARARPSERGIRQFVVGTGGSSLYELGEAQPNSEARQDQAYGVLDLTLNPDGYAWEFVPLEEGRFSDTGSARCT
mgnify:CR=1 FL=1